MTNNKVRAIEGREDFIKHIQEVEAFLGRSDPGHMDADEAAAYAGALWDALEHTRAETGKPDSPEEG